MVENMTNTESPVQYTERDYLNIELIRNFLDYLRDYHDVELPEYIIHHFYINLNSNEERRGSAA